MSLRIACDLDGTIADMDAALQREAQRLFGPDVDLHAAPGGRVESAEDLQSQVDETPIAPEGDDELPEPVSPLPGQGGRPLTNRELRVLWQHVSQIENFWTTLGEIEPGVVARLASLATQYRWEVIFLTQRPASAGETTQVQSQRWLRAHGFELPGVMVMHGSRGKVADALTLDAVIDDRPENCLDVATDSSAMPILIWRLRPELVPAGLVRTRIEPVFSFAEALAKLEQLTAERSRKRGLLGRLRSAFSRQ